MRLLPRYAERRAPWSVVPEAARAAPDEARWTGYTAVIIASGPDWRPNDHEGKRTTSGTRSDRPLVLPEVGPGPSVKLGIC